MTDQACLPSTEDSSASNRPATRAGGRIRIQSIVWLAAALALVVATGVQAGERRTLLNSGWTFALDTADNGDASEWQPVSLPHTWNDRDGSNKRSPYFRGTGIYRRTLQVDDRLRGQALYLYFEGANQVAEVLVNGKTAGRHVGGYSAFAVDISDLVHPDADNDIEVRVDNRHDDTVPPLNADFTFYGGLYRDAWLLAFDDVHFEIDDFGATALLFDTQALSAETATVAVSGSVRNRSNRARQVVVSATIEDADGREVAGVSAETSIAARGSMALDIGEIEISNPRLWSPESPHLYRAVVSIHETGVQLDRVEYPLGLRWFEIDADRGFVLNGEPYRLFGTNRHQDRAGYGNALPDVLHRADVQRIKDDGFNFLRLAHYPQDPAVLEAADELGLIVWEETPVVNLIDLSDAFGANAERMVREMIRQHRHHPSIVFWGYMNEVTLRKPQPLPDGYYEAVVDLAQRLERVAKEEDPSRATVMALSRDELIDDVALEDISDILAFNLYFGWYYEDFATLGEFLDEYRRRNPGRPLMISEYGAGSDERVHALNSTAFDFSTEYQQRYHEANFAQILDRPWLLGSAVWNHFDFGSSHRQDSKFGINQKGLWYYDRTPKDVAYYYRAQLLDEPVLHIATRDWQYRAGSSADDATMPVKVYSNAETVELKLNGASQGVKPVVNAVAEWHVTFRAGRNRLLALSEKRQDQTVVSYEDRGEFFTDGPERGSIYINAGSGEVYVDARNRVWEADRAYRRGSWGFLRGTAERSHHRIFDTADDPLYQTRRLGRTEYRFDVPDGQYCAELHYADFDSYTARTTRHTLQAVRGRLRIRVDKLDQHDFVNGIALHRGNCDDAGSTAVMPNVVFILADDIGYGDLSVYGGQLPTPRIDELASAGIRFTDAHSPAALCAPTRFSLLTGSYPYRNGRPGGTWDINYSSGFTAGAGHLDAKRHITVGEILQRAGYVTGFIGKMHLGGDVFDASGEVIREKSRLNEMDFRRGIADGPNAHGFDYSYALASGIQHEPYAYFENGRYEPVDPGDPADNTSTVLLTDGIYQVGANGVSEIVEAATIPARADRNYDSSQVGIRLTQKAVNFIERHANRNERPFALYFASQAIHVPHTPPIDFDGNPEPVDVPVAGVTGGPTTDMIRELDLQVGAIVDALADAGALENTLIFFTSDNGALPDIFTDYGERTHDSNGPWRDYKSSVYEGGHRVPFIARWGDGTATGSEIPPGSVSRQTIVNQDWVATMYELTRQPMAADQAMDSASLLPLMLGRFDAPIHDFVIYQAGYAYLGGLREGDYVLVVDEEQRATELYDLATDPAQTRNLIDDARQRNRVDRMRRTFLYFHDRDKTTFSEPRTTVPVASITSAKSDQTVEAMSFNIWHDRDWQARKDLVVAAIREEDPDIVGLQEALVWQLEFLADQLPQYAFEGVGRDDGNEKGETVGILFRKDRFDVAESGTFWFSDEPDSPGSMPGKEWGNPNFPRICTWLRLVDRSSGRGLYVYNVHFQHDAGDDPELARTNSAKLLVERISQRPHDDPVIVTGDFNAVEESAAIRHLTSSSPFEYCPAHRNCTELSNSQPLLDAYRVSRRGDAEGSRCFDNDNTGRRIDYILASAGSEVTGFSMGEKINGRCPSDHRYIAAAIVPWE